MIQSDHVAISTAQELISGGWLVSKRFGVGNLKVFPTHCIFFITTDTSRRYFHAG